MGAMCVMSGPVGCSALACCAAACRVLTCRALECLLVRAQLSHAFAVVCRRPSFKELTPQLQLLLDMVKEEEARKAASSSKGGLLSKLNLRGKEGSGRDSRQQQ